MKSEVIGKRIEVLMPEIFKAGHSDMLSKKVKKMEKNKSDRNLYFQKEKKKLFYNS